MTSTVLIFAPMISQNWKIQSMQTVKVSQHNIQKPGFRTPNIMVHWFNAILSTSTMYGGSMSLLLWTYDDELSNTKHHVRFWLLVNKTNT